MLGNGPQVLGIEPHVLGNGPLVLGNGPHVLGNEPHVLGNGPHSCNQFMNAVILTYYGEVRLGRLFILALLG